MWMFRLAGWCCRMCWWLVFWPVGAVLSARAGTRRRHRETVTALRQAPPAGPYPCRRR